MGVAAAQGFGDRPPTPLPSTWLAERGATPYPPTLNPLLLPYPTPRVSRTQENETWRSVLERSALAEVRSRSVLEAHVREGSHGAAPGLVRPA